MVNWQFITQIFQHVSIVQQYIIPKTANKIYPKNVSYARKLMKRRTITASFKEKNLNKLKKKKEFYHDLIFGQLYKAQFQYKNFYIKADYQYFKKFLIFHSL